MLRALTETTHKTLRSVYWRVFIRPRSSTIDLVRASKAQRQASGLQFKDAPLVSVIIQSFNQVRNVELLESRLRLTCLDELIVCEDGSVDGSYERWQRLLSRPNDFLIRSNDLHEIRTYSRAIDFTRAEFICLMQDDDRPPVDGSWLARAVEIFRYHPRLAVLGGWCGFNNYFAEAYNAPWLPPGEGLIPYRDPNTNLPLMFVENVNIGPYILRRSAYKQLGGFDLAFSAPGTPGICFESEFCYRAWQYGYEVGLTDMPAKLRKGYGGDGYIFPGGTLLWGRSEREHNEIQNKKRIVELYDADLPSIQRKVAEANQRLQRIQSPAG